jgi:hypothetical protein
MVVAAGIVVDSSGLSGCSFKPSARSPSAIVIPKRTALKPLPLTVGTVSAAEPAAAIAKVQA